jgi:hypothetical protein
VLLLIEVADNSLRVDREIKVPLYVRHGIPEVSILAIDERRLCRFALPEEGTYRVQETIDPSRPAPISRVPHCTLDLSDLI